MADSEGSGSRRREEEQRNAIDEWLNKSYPVYTGPKDENQYNGREMAYQALAQNNFRQNQEEEAPAPPSDNSWEQIVAPEEDSGPEPEPTPQPEYNEPVDTGRFGPKLSPVENLVEPVVQEQTEEKTPQGYLRAERNTPKTEKNPVDKPETVNTPSETYQNWQEYLRMLDEAERANDELFRLSNQEPDVSVLGNGYVQPVTPAFDPMQYLNDARARVAAMAANVNTTPPVGSPQYLSDNGLSWAGNGQGSGGAVVNTTSVTDDYPGGAQAMLEDGIRIRMGQGESYDQALQETRADIARQNLLAAAGNGINYQPYQPPTSQGTGSNTPQTTSASDRNLGNFQAFLELGRDQGLSGSELVEYAADELNRNSAGNGYVPTNYLIENPNPQNANVEKPFDFWAKVGASIANADEYENWLANNTDLYTRPFNSEEERNAYERNLGSQFEQLAAAGEIEGLIGSDEIREKINEQRAKEQEQIDALKRNAEERSAQIGYESAAQTAEDTGLIPGTMEYDMAVYEAINNNRKIPSSVEPRPVVNPVEQWETQTYTPSAATTTETTSETNRPNLFDSVGDWFSGLFNPTPAPYDTANAAPVPVTTTPQNTPAQTTTTPAPQSNPAPTTTGNQGNTPFPSTNYYNPDSSAYYNRKFDDIMFADTYGKDSETKDPKTVSGEAARKLLANRVDIDPKFADLIASDIDYSSRKPRSETVEMTDDEYKSMMNSFLDANPAIGDMLVNKEITIPDIVNLYFKDVVEPGTGSSGSGNGKGNGTSIPEDSRTYTPSYEQGGKVVKAPYRKGGYSEDELKAMGNNPYTDYRGYKAYEGYYYNVYDKKWYPVDQDKANYYNAKGTYSGYTDDMKNYYNTFGTYYGYRPGWRTAGRAGGGGGSRGGGGGGGGSYGGGSYGSSTPSTKTQSDDRVNNIMKNWSF